jgi:hypothetical protein
MNKYTWLIPLVLAGACADDRKVYAGLDFEITSATPDPVSIRSDRITLVAGEAVRVTATPVSSERDYTRGDTLALRAEDEAVLEVYAGQDDREFVLVGLTPGTTCLSVRIDRREEDCIDVRVLAPTD